MGQVYQNTRSNKHCKDFAKGNAMIFSDFHSQVSAGTARNPNPTSPPRPISPLEEPFHSLLDILNIARSQIFQMDSPALRRD
jgi:hypothetical protein